MKLSVLQNAQASAVVTEPYPHIIIRNALPAELCDRLIAEYPDFDTLGVDPGRNNVRWSYPACKVSNNAAISDTWRELIEYHVSPAFFNEFLDLFASYIVDLFPTAFPDEAVLRQLQLGLRETGNFEESGILLDAQISGNTPVTQERSVKPNHIDSHRKLFAGLFYLRRDDDDSIGADLEVRRFRPEYTGKNSVKCYDGVYVDNRYTDLVETVKYYKNVLILFINSPVSLHGVTKRQPTPYPRLFMNLVGEVKEPLFTVPRTFSTRIKKLQRQVKKRAIRLTGGEYIDPYKDGY